MNIANPDARDLGMDRTQAAATRTQGPHLVGTQPSLTLVDDRLALTEPEEAPSAAWDAAMMQIAGAMNISIRRVAQDRPQGLRQRVKLPWGSGSAPDAPIFAPWLSHSCLAFQDTRGARDLFPARWVASYLWDPCGTRPRGGGLDVMLISPHPAACRRDEECAAALPGTRLLQEMIGAAHTEGRSRVAVIGYERSRSAIARQLLSAKPALPGAAIDLEVLAIEAALARLASNPATWDAIIVLPELRSLVFTLLAELSGIGGAWPMVWHRNGLALLCGETAGAAPENGPLDAALLVQGLALAARDGGKAFAARRLSQTWARLRDRGVATTTRGSASPYAMHAGDADLVELLCKEPEAAGRPVTMWKAMTPTASSKQGTGETSGPARLALVQDR